MNESTNNPLNDFLNQAEEEPENNLFAPIPFPSQPEPVGAAVPVPPPVPAPQAPAAEMPGIPAIPPGADASTGSNAFNHASPAEAYTQ